jgi:hypothetical protein
MKAAVAQRPPRTKTKHCGNSHRPSSEPQQHYTEAQLCEWRERVALALLSQKPPAGYSWLFRRARAGGRLLVVAYDDERGGVSFRCEGRA